MTQRKNIIQMLALLGLALITGCAAPKYISKDFDADKVGAVACLPCIDARARPDPKHDFKYFGSQATAAVVCGTKFGRRYQLVYTTYIGDVAEYSAKVIEPAPDKHADPAVVKQMGPPAAKWVLVPVCEDLNHWNALLAQGASAKISLYLFNKETGELWWKGCGAASESYGFLISGIAELFDKYAYENDVIMMAGSTASGTLPRPKSAAIKAGRGYFFNRGTVQTAAGLQRIAVTPTIDGRRRISEKNPYEPKPFQDKIVKVLCGKGFDAAPVDSYGQQTVPSKEQVSFADVAFGKSLGIDGYRYVMVPVAEEMGRFPRFGHFCEATMYLFDTATGEVIWQGTSFDSSPEGSIKALGKGFPKRKTLPK
ncbi:MAG TPA: hypothetical protein P5205_08205 [Candidatus Paceibacterota bacterium]|nr:hypothetical protein [Verrucomicrobiota bacterium]HSA10341.1 hypothetical protein [Candidatus Paceibacterota bacterium]